MAVRPTRADLIKAARSLVGVPYKPGDVRSGANCGGMVACCLREMGLVEFADALRPHTGFAMPVERGSLLKGMMQFGFFELRPKGVMDPGDILMFRTGLDRWTEDYRHLAILTRKSPDYIVHADNRETVMKIVEVRRLKNMKPRKVFRILGLADS